MSLGDIHPYDWGQVCRYIEAEMDRRGDLDEAARKAVSHAFGVMLHSRRPRDFDGKHGPVCALCGQDRALGIFIACARGEGRGRRFTVVWRTKPPPELLVCGSCCSDRVTTLESRLLQARKILDGSKEAARHGPLFDKVFGQRILRRADADPCAACGSSGDGLRGPPQVTVCLRCILGAQDAWDDQQRKMRQAESRRKEEHEGRLRETWAAMWAVAEQDAAGAIRALARRGDIEAPQARAPGRDRPPFGAKPLGAADEEARWAVAFLDREVERALRHEHGTADLLGDAAGIRRASAALRERELSPAVLERLLRSVSMLRQVMELGVQFYDPTGDELVNEENPGYEQLAARITVGVHPYARTAMEGGVVVFGGTPAERERVAGAIRRLVVSWSRSPWSRSEAPMQYVEAYTLYSMTPKEQAEVRRRMLIAPPWATVFGADDLDRFVEETPKRCAARIVTYLFMNGQEHLNLDEGKVHVGGPPPPGGIPR